MLDPHQQDQRESWRLSVPMSEGVDANSHLVFNLLGEDVPTEDLCGHDFDFTLTETNGKRERFADPMALRCKLKKSIKIM